MFFSMEMVAQIIVITALVHTILTDIQSRNISNKAVMVILVYVVVIYIVNEITYSQWFVALACSVVMLVGGFILWNLGFLGAGDVKLITALTALFGAHPTAMTVWILCTATVLILWFVIIKLLAWFHLEPWAPRFLSYEDLKDRGIPLALSISPAAIWVILNSM